ncbi:MAG: sialate O-acetylesterase [bacterium]
MGRGVRALGICVLLAALAGRSRGGEARNDGEEAMGARRRFHLYLLIGQSNMAGRGAVAKEDKTPHPRVFALNQQDEWVPAAEPLHFDKPMAGVGPGLAFGKAMAEANPRAKVGLIPCSAGGSPISVWTKGGYWKQTRSRPYDEALRRVAVARRRGVLKGILWHQGESDSNSTDAPLYAERLDALIARLRRDLRAPKTPVLVGGLSDHLIARNRHAKAVDRALRQLPERVERTAYVPAEGIGLKSDNAHFTAPAARTLGRRYAKALLSLRTPQSPR